MCVCVCACAREKGRQRCFSLGKNRDNLYMTRILSNESGTRRRVKGLKKNKFFVFSDFSRDCHAVRKNTI